VRALAALVHDAVIRRRAHGAARVDDG